MPDPATPANSASISCGAHALVFELESVLLEWQDMPCFAFLEGLSEALTQARSEDHLQLQNNLHCADFLSPLSLRRRDSESAASFMSPLGSP